MEMIVNTFMETIAKTQILFIKKKKKTFFCMEGKFSHSENHHGLPLVPKLYFEVSFKG